MSDKEETLEHLSFHMLIEYTTTTFASFTQNLNQVDIKIFPFQDFFEINYVQENTDSVSPTISTNSSGLQALAFWECTTYLKHLRELRTLTYQYNTRFW